MINHPKKQNRETMQTELGSELIPSGHGDDVECHLATRVSTRRQRVCDGNSVHGGLHVPGNVERGANQVAVVEHPWRLEKIPA